MGVVTVREECFGKFASDDDAYPGDAWDMAAQVAGTPLDMKWDTRAEVTRALSMLWDIRVPVDGQGLDLAWDIRGAVNADPLELRWDLVGSVAALLRLRWAIEGAPGTLPPGVFREARAIRRGQAKPGRRGILESLGRRSLRPNPRTPGRAD